MAAGKAAVRWVAGRAAGYNFQTRKKDMEMVTARAAVMGMAVLAPTALQSWDATAARRVISKRTMVVLSR